MVDQVINDKNTADLYASLTRNNDSDVRDYMRPIDIRIFKRYSINRGVFVLVRRTNIYSVPYIGKPGFVPKPLECKPKTAKSDADFLNEKGKRIKLKCAGLVVNPFLLKDMPFKNKGIMLNIICGKHSRHGENTGGQEFRLALRFN